MLTIVLAKDLGDMKAAVILIRMTIVVLRGGCCSI
jgi:hypothetical protein